MTLLTLCIVSEGVTGVTERTLKIFGLLGLMYVNAEGKFLMKDIITRDHFMFPSLISLSLQIACFRTPGSV